MMNLDNDRGYLDEMLSLPTAGYDPKQSYTLTYSRRPFKVEDTVRAENCAYGW